MIRLLDVNKFIRGLKGVTATEYFTRTGEFHSDGLFSETIFGPVGSKERSQTFSYIDLQAKIVHPSALKLVLQLDKKVEKFLSTEEKFDIDKSGNLIISEDGVTGINEFIKLFPRIKFRGETETREKFIKVLEDSHKKGTLFIDKLPVIPPDMRPAFQDEDKNWIIDPLNEYYTTILRRSMQLRSSSGTGPLFDLLNYSLQLAVISHDNFVRTRIAKKPGIIRSDILGKRIDFSGRAVITPNPDLKVNEVGLPLRLAVSIFEPFIINKLMYSKVVNREELQKEIKNFTDLDLSTDSIQKVLKSIRAKDKIPKNLYDLFFAATEAAIAGRVVICKRDPALHAESVRGYFPILVHGDTLQICTLQVGGHGADFDGDTMAVYHPLTNEAQEEVKLKMTRSQSGTSSHSITFEMSKEMYVGLYSITKQITMRKSPISVNDKDLETATEPFIPVIYRDNTTSMGRAIANSCLPKNFRFIDEQFTKKLIKQIIDELFEKYDDEVVRESVSKLEKTGFKFATIMAPSITLDDITIPTEIYELKSKLKDSSTEEAIALIDKMKSLLVKHLKGTGLYDLIDSGSGKGWDQPAQILIAKGIISDPTGKLLEPIKDSFSEGLTNEEFFNASSGARKGIIDRVINTASTGYMSRKLAFVLNSVEADLYLRDCKTNKTITLKLTKDLISRLSGRFVIKNNKVIEFNPSEYKEGDVINLRSPIYCRSPKVCHICYGKLLVRHKSPYIGIIAAQTIGERGTQLIMRTFHTGGVVQVQVRDVLKDILENDPLVNLQR